MTAGKLLQSAVENELDLILLQEYKESWNFDDKVELFGKAGWERFRNPVLVGPFYEDILPENYIFGGVGVNWYPLEDSQDLRFHALVSANSLDGTVAIGVGLTYNFSVYSK